MTTETDPGKVYKPKHYVQQREGRKKSRTDRYYDDLTKMESSGFVDHQKAYDIFTWFIRQITKFANLELSKGSESYGKDLLATIESLKKEHPLDRYYLEDDTFNAYTSLVEDYMEATQKVNEWLVQKDNTGNRDMTSLSVPAKFLDWGEILKKIVVKGKFNFYFGESGVGKTNSLVFLVHEMLKADPDLIYVGSLAYYSSSIKHSFPKRMFKITSARSMVKKVMQLRKEKPDAKILVVIEELMTAMNRTANRTKIKETGQIESFTFQMRKLGISVIGVMQAIRNLAPVFRGEYEGDMTKHSSAYFHHGETATLIEGQITRIPITGELRKKKHLLIELNGGNTPFIPVREIPNYHIAYNTEETTSWKPDFNFTQWYNDITNDVSEPVSEKDRPRWRASICEHTLIGLKKGRWTLRSKQDTKLQQVKDTAKRKQDNLKLTHNEEKQRLKEKVKEIEEEQKRKEYLYIGALKENRTWKEVAEEHFKRTGENTSGDVMRMRYAKLRKIFS